MDTLWILVFLFGYLHTAVSQTTSAPKPSLKITAFPHPPYIFQSDDGNFTGFIPDILDVLAERLNFDYTMYTPADEKYGRYVNGTWQGMVGEVVNGNADIALPLTVSYQRSLYVDFTYPLQSADPAIVLKRPLKQSPSIQESLIKLLVPMEFPVWLMTVLAFMVTSTVLYIISHANPYEWRRMAKDKEATVREAESFTCLNTFWFVISTLAWQGYVRAPRSMGARITVAAWWFFVLIFILSYTASLTNFLRVGPAPLEAKGYSTIQSFADLATNDDVSVGMLSSGSTAMGFERSPVAEEAKLYRKLLDFEKQNKKISSYLEGIEFLRTRPFLDFAFVMEAPSAKYEVFKEPCDLYMISDPRTSRFISMALPKKSPYLEKINGQLLKMYESGMMTAIEKRWFESNKCDSAVYESRRETYKVATFYQLDLGTFSGALLILVCGLVLGGLVTCIEVCIYKCAEGTPDEEDEAPPAGQIEQNDYNTSEKLLLAEPKRGGATQV